jgi:hypothetical protein
MKVQIEVTDTFDGQANYSWVIRQEYEGEYSRLQLVKMARRLAGWTGTIRTTNYGGMVEVRPYRICQVAFITFLED